MIATQLQANNANLNPWDTVIKFSSQRQGPSIVPPSVYATDVIHLQLGTDTSELAPSQGLGNLCSRYRNIIRFSEIILRLTDLKRHITKSHIKLTAAYCAEYAYLPVPAKACSMVMNMLLQ